MAALRSARRTAGDLNRCAKIFLLLRVLFDPEGVVTSLAIREWGVGTLSEVGEELRDHRAQVPRAHHLFRHLHQRMDPQVRGSPARTPSSAGWPFRLHAAQGLVRPPHLPSRSRVQQFATCDINERPIGRGGQEQVHSGQDHLPETDSARAGAQSCSSMPAMGWAFRAIFPRSAIHRASPSAHQPISRGAHGDGGFWLVNGAGDRILSIGVPVRLRQLLVSVDEPQALAARLTS